MDSSSSAVVLVYSPQRLNAIGLTLIGILPTLAGREGQWAMIFLVKEASESRLLGQRPLSCKVLIIPATGSLELALLTIKYEWRAGAELYGKPAFSLVFNVSFVRRKIRAGIFKESMGPRNRGGIGLSYRPARLHRLAEFIPWNRFLGSIKYGLRVQTAYTCVRV
jgi:hypothetical protein